MFASILTGEPSLDKPEVWFWRAGGLKIFTLRPDGSGYEPVAQRRLLPKLDVTLFERCVKIPSWQQARREFRAALACRK